MDSPEIFSPLGLFLVAGNGTICFPCVCVGVPAFFFVATAQFFCDDTFFFPCFGGVGAVLLLTGWLLNTQGIVSGYALHL
jgi:hypothetical protein